MKKKVYYKLNRYKVAKVEVESVEQEQAVKILNRETDRFAKSEDTYYVEYLFEQYQPYMWWVLLATAGVWSVVMGVFFGIAAKNEDKEKARKMIKNYVIGLVVIAVILVACPYLVRGIAALIAG